MSEKAVVVEKDKLMQVQGFFQKNQRPILVVLFAIVIGVGGVFAYNKFIKQPKEEQASEASYKMQQYFGMDSSNLVLNGDGTNKGALSIIKNYDGTKAADLARFYAGISYLKLKDFNNAIKYLKEFSTDSKPTQMLAYTNLGHAYAEAGKKDDAVESYKKAGNTFVDDENGSAENLALAAGLLQTMNKNKEALELYKEIKSKYPNATKAAEADKNIYKLSTSEKNDFSIN
jgi:tetratricopeptide (TPR) repeat protein